MIVINILDVGTGHADNSRDQLDTAAFESNVDTSDLKGTLYDKIRAMLNRLDKQLKATMSELETNEIQAALNTARYQIRAAQEVDRLEADKVKRFAYLDKLAIDLEVAFAYEAKMWEISQKSDAEVKGAKNDLAEKKHFWEQETERRNGELETLDFIIDIFLTQIATMGDAMRLRIDDYVHDERFDQGIFGSKTDKNVDSIGNVASEVAAAAGL